MSRFDQLFDNLNNKNQAPAGFIKQELTTYFEVDGSLKKVVVSRRFEKNKHIESYHSEIISTKLSAKEE